MAVCHTPRPEVEVLMGRAEELVGHKRGRIEGVREGELSVFFWGGQQKKHPMEGGFWKSGPSNFVGFFHVCVIFVPRPPPKKGRKMKFLKLLS